MNNKAYYIQNLLKICIINTIFLLLIGCGNDVCIDADDFGFARMSISARYPDDTTIINDQNQSVNFSYTKNYQGQTVGAWIDSGYNLNGDPLTVLVRNWKYNKFKNNATPSFLSAWSPWFGNKTNYNNLPVYLLNLRSCTFYNGDTCASTQPDKIRIPNAPCLMTKGVGLFGAIMKEDMNKSKDPNKNAITMFNPSLSIPDAYVFHVGDPSNNAGLYDINNFYTFGNDADSSSHAAGGIVVGCGTNASNCSVPFNTSDYAGGKLYFKIVDTDYSDNAGQYIALIKSGVKNLGFDPFRSLADEFRVMIFGGFSQIQNSNLVGVVPGIYNNILSNTSYINTVQAMLILSIMFFAMSFLIGMVQFTQSELFFRIFKIILISVLINTDISWDFFNKYFFNIFINGLTQIQQLVQQAATGGQEQGPESIIALIFSEQTMAKLLSMLLVDLSGWFYFIIFMVLAAFIVVMYLKAYILYVTALLMTGIIISLAPIFLCFMLFGMTRYLYDNWLKKLVVYSFQLIILFAALAFLGSMVRDEIYSSLGFKVCQLPIIDLGITEKPLLSMYYPDPKTAASFRNSLQPKNLTNIAVPKSKTTYTSVKNQDGSVSYTTNFQAAYTYKEDRYLDLPFLDPTDPRDADRLDRFRSQGITVDFVGLFELILITLILYKFNDSTINIANTIIGNSGSGGALSGVSNSIGKDVEGYQKRVSSAISKQLKSYSAVKGGMAAYNTAKYSLLGAKNQLSKRAELYTSLLSQEQKKNFVKDHKFLASAFGVTKSLDRLESLDKKQQYLGFKYNLNKLELKKTLFDKFNAKSPQDSRANGPRSEINQSYYDKAVEIGDNIKSSGYNSSISFLQDMIDPQLAKAAHDQKRQEDKMDKKSLEEKEKLAELQSWQKEKNHLDHEYQKALDELNKEPKKSRNQLLSELKEKRDKQLNELYQKYDGNKDF